MTRLIKFFVFTFAFTLGVSAHAALLELNATNDFIEPGRFSDFTIVFEDTGDGLLDVSEILSFSGVDEIFGMDRSWDAVLTVPEILGFTTGTGPFWVFYNSVEDYDNSWLAERWAYSITEASVPEPSSLFLLAMGIASLLISRKRKV